MPQVKVITVKQTEKWQSVWNVNEIRREAKESVFEVRHKLVFAVTKVV